jgi:lincosamide nucleotidyltransferase A/C/D/E
VLEPGLRDRRALRGRVLRLARRLYRAAYFSRLRPLLQLRPVQRLRARLAHPITGADVLETVDALSRAGVRCWLAGGWGIDALAGRQTRPHRDLDLLIDEADAARAEATLAAVGYGRIPEALPGTLRFVPWSLMPHRVFVRDGEGRMIDLHPVRSAEWPGVPSVPEAFATGTVDGRVVDCLSVWAQAATHEGYDVLDEHRPDLEVLARLVEGAGGDPARPA